MKNLIIIFLASLFTNLGFSQILSEKFNLHSYSFTTQSTNVLNSVKQSQNKSFYQSKSEWQSIIDNKWGAGIPLVDKLALFDKYVGILTNRFTGFNSLGISWNEWNVIKTTYRSKINTNTSKGAFASLMGHLSYDLYDAHTRAQDLNVLLTPLNQGIPILMLTPYDDSHFGATLTVLPDSSLLVLWTIENHPLGLQPGDVVVGYEGVPWKHLVDELLASEIPIGFQQRNVKSASRHNELASAGNNWHLFETIDVIKYGSTDTTHLFLDPLRTLNVSEIFPKEQLPVPGVPFPDPTNIIQPVYYGKVEGTNIGYIYIFGENENTDDQLYQAILSLNETEGLIIDLRKNVGGWPLPSSGLDFLFNSFKYTLEDVARCNTLDFSLCSTNNRNLWNVNGNPESWYDKPIAVLTGPNCISCGEYIAYILSYRPMVRFFGKTTCGALGWESDNNINNIDGWLFTYSPKSAVRVSDPEILLTYREFPVDEKIWFDKESAARREDPVAKKAIEWIKNSTYVTEITASPMIRIYPNPAEDKINIEINYNGDQDIGIELFSISGQLVYRKEFQNSHGPFIKQIDISSYVKGMYLLKISQSCKLYCGKIIIL